MRRRAGAAAAAGLAVPHHYEFTLFALDAAPQIADTANVHQFLDGIRGHVLASGRITGLSGR